MTATTLNYAADRGDRAAWFVFDAAWSGIDRVPTSVEVTDARTLPTAPRLERDGFELARIVSGVTDYGDAGQLERLWVPAVKEAVRRLTGAAWVACWGTNARLSRPSADGLTVTAPARIVHSDLSPEFDPMRMAEEPGGAAAAAEIAERLGGRAPRRWRAFNVWQAISPPPQDVPFAVCALPSVAADDVIDGHASDGSPDSRDYRVSLFQANPRHRWYSFADMLPGEALVFSAFDPEAGPLHGRVPHSAYDPPEPVANAVPRSSIEIRALAIYDS